LFRDEWSAEIRRELEELRVKRARVEALTAERARVATELEGAEGLLRDFEAAARRYEGAVARARERFERLSRVLARWERVAERRPEFREVVERYRRSVEEARRRWLRLLGALERWRRLVEGRRVGVEALRARVAELDTRVADLRRLIAEEEEAIRRKRPIQILTVVDSRTGYDISLLAYPIEGKRVWTVHPETGQLIKPVEYVEIQWTASIETEGHEPLGKEFNPCEVTAQTVLDEDDFPKIEEVTAVLREQAIETLLSIIFWGNIPVRAVKDDFEIQKKKKDAKYEGVVKRWFYRIEGVWEEIKVLKEGVGYYVMSEGEVEKKELDLFEEFGERLGVRYPNGVLVVEMPARPATYYSTLNLMTKEARYLGRR